jgi:formylglycine-generating enzyme required for sulfatase activity
MIGNVWEWTHDFWALPAAAKPCCTPGARPALPRRVVKGGSHLCAPNYCRRYRPAARQPQEIDTATTHVGFRCVSSP